MTAQSKTCARCKKSKPAGEFNRHKSRKDGLQQFCRSCQREYYRSYQANRRAEITDRMRSYRAENRDQINAYDREHYDRNRGRINERQRKYKAANPHKADAHIAIRLAISRGDLLPAESNACFAGLDACAGTADEYHHVDYGKPLEVIPVCKSCHHRWHAVHQQSADGLTYEPLVKKP